MQRSAYTFILPLFFLSGACTLVYQVIWVRMLVLVFGMSVFAVSTVLTAFMAGLALGSFYFGRLADRIENGLRLYALLELGIGAFALAFPLVLAGLDEIYTALYQPLQATPYLFSLIRFALCFLVLLIPTTLMGGTLPVLIKFAVRQLSQVGWGAGGLYAANTFGAAIGVVVAAYLAIEHLGIGGTTLAAAATNGLVALLALWWYRRAATVDRDVAVSDAESVERNRPALTVGLGRLALFAFALSGFTALGYEVVWTRVLTTMLGMSTAQSLSIILIAFLLGLAGGGAVAARFVDRWRNLLAAFGLIELLLGLFGLVSIAAFGTSTYFLPYLSALSSWTGHLFGSAATAFWIMLVPTCLMGALFPLVGRLNVANLPSLGRKIGEVYGVNTLGAIGGAFGTGFLLIPALGTQNTVQVLAWINVAIGVVLLLADPLAGRPRKLLTIGVPLGAALWLSLALPANLFIALFAMGEKDEEVIYCDEAVAGTVTVHQLAHGNRILKVNGMGEVPTDYASVKTFRLLGNLPLLLHRDPQQVLVIAFGGGVSLGSAVLHQPQRIDCAEVVPGVVGAAAYFARYNNYVHHRLDTPQLRLIRGDGRNHVKRTNAYYDIVIADATHPGTADSWVLYTEEFYRLCRARLNEGGALAQWLPLHGLAVEDYKMILRTFRAVFPHASLWLTDEYSILLGTDNPLHIDFKMLEERLAVGAIKENLREVDLDDPISLLGTLALDEIALSRYAGAGPTNTDDRPYIGFTDRRRGAAKAGRPVLASLVPHLVEAVDGFLFNAAEEEVEKIERRLRSREYLVQGGVALLEKDVRAAQTQFKQARAADVEERTALRALRRLEGARAKR